MPPVLPPQDGFLFLDREKFAHSFAADLPAEEAAFMADSQVPWGVEALNGAVSAPAWRGKPSWYLVATDDRMIPPAAQRAMAARAGATMVEEAGSHSIYVSKQHAVAELIKQAATRAVAQWSGCDDGDSQSLSGEPAWKMIPSWYLVATRDRASMVSRRAATLKVILAAAQAAA